MKTYQELFEAKKRIPNNKVLIMRDPLEDDPDWSGNGDVHSIVIPKNMIAKIFERNADLWEGWDNGTEFEGYDVKDFAKELQKATPKAKSWVSGWLEGYYVKKPWPGLAIPNDDMFEWSAVKSGELSDMTGIKKNEMFILDKYDPDIIKS